MADASKLESIWRYTTIVSALVAAVVGIEQYRRGVSQSVRELEWRQAEMARTLINAMINDEGWQALTMLDWEEGRNYEIAPGTRVRILPREVPEALEASLRTKGRQRTDPAIHYRPIRPLSVPRESAADGGTLGPGKKGRCQVSAQLVHREAALWTQEAAA